MNPGTMFIGTDGESYVAIDPTSCGGLWRGLDGMCVRLRDGALVHYSHVHPEPAEVRCDPDCC